MEFKELRRRCEQRLHDLDLPVPFDVLCLRDYLAEQRGRSIILRPIASKAGLLGMWVAIDAADVIFYAADTCSLHQQHIILHELSHLLCGHQVLPPSDPAYLQLLLPDISPEAISSILGRAAYSTDEECEAELLASLILERAAYAAVETPPSDSESVDVLDRLIALLPGEERTPR